jgi:hypothetical protein
MREPRQRIPVVSVLVCVAILLVAFVSRHL